MKYFDTKSAIKSFYYLIAVDGKITPDELTKLDEVGAEIDPEGYSTYKDQLIAECAGKVQKYVGQDDYSDILQELIDEALSETEITERISTRMVIWNMMVLAHSDESFDEEERKVIRHIARLTETEYSVILEMDQILKAYRDVMTELEWLGQSQRPYAEIRPHVEEIENRKKVLMRDAMELIADEVLAPIPEEIIKAKKKREDKEAFDRTVKNVTDKVQETTNDISEGFRKVMDENVKPKAEAVGKKMQEEFAEKSKEATEGLKKGVGKLLGRIGSKNKNKASDSDGGEK